MSTCQQGSSTSTSCTRRRVGTPERCTCIAAIVGQLSQSRFVTPPALPTPHSWPRTDLHGPRTLARGRRPCFVRPHLRSCPTQGVPRSHHLEAQGGARTGRVHVHVPGIANEVLQGRFWTGTHQRARITAPYHANSHHPMWRAMWCAVRYRTNACMYGIFECLLFTCRACAHVPVSATSAHTRTRHGTRPQAPASGCRCSATLPPALPAGAAFLCTVACCWALYDTFKFR